ncbi:hypothetical protein [Fictibacillus phosphorivorans]|uniref:hypothetical protein n=1 Tax=Fictibacillus phosphorivorans TaxID=1221500 RepID=UPI00203E0EFB|nr:hypothetical protein [Fictibacillus phosphorivorans]MCM3719226.1 hypothetical protein [Fictibacillus phosphorivorans]MCM3776848.1 hypothetical protein [Fictibacillus phosphorivorans]
MGLEKVKFKLELKEEDKGLKYVLILIILGLLISGTALSMYRGEDEDFEPRMVATEWARAELQSNVSLKYNLLSEKARTTYVDVVPDERKQTKVEEEFEEYDLFQWKIKKDEIIYKVHYYGMKTCPECQKAIWVRVKAENGKWVVPEFNFTEYDAAKRIKGIEAEQIPTTLEQEEEMEKKKSIFERVLNL